MRWIFLDKNGWCYVLCCGLFWVHTLHATYHRPEYGTIRKYGNDIECQCVMYIYYYYLCLVTPALRKCHKVSNARRHLTRAIPWMKGYRLPKPDTMSASVVSEETAVPVREQLLRLAETAVRDAAHRAEGQGLGSLYKLHTPNITKWQTTPNTASAAKNKSISVPSGGDIEAVPRTPWLGQGIQPVSGPLTLCTEGKTGLRSTNPMYGRRPLTPGASPAGACSVP